MTTGSEPVEQGASRCVVCGHEVAADPLFGAGEAPCTHCGHLVWFRLQELEDGLLLNLLADMNPERAEIERVGRLLVQSHPKPRIIVNFYNVEFISSTFLNRLIQLHQTVESADGRLKLSGMNPVIREIFEINKLDGLFGL